MAGMRVQTARRRWRLAEVVPADVRRQLFLLLDDNYFSRSTTITPDLFRGREAPPRAGGEARPSLFCSFLREKTKRRWESGKHVLGFKLFHQHSTRSCGNVGISLLWARFPRGSWEAWETCFWFSRLSTAPPFPQLSSLLISRG